MQIRPMVHPILFLWNLSRYYRWCKYLSTGSSLWGLFVECNVPILSSVSRCRLTTEPGYTCANLLELIGKLEVQYVEDCVAYCYKCGHVAMYGGEWNFIDMNLYFWLFITKYNLSQLPITMVLLIVQDRQYVIYMKIHSP